MDNKEVFAQNLIYYINRTGRMQKEVAEACGISASTLNDYCRGKKFPRLDKLERLCNWFSQALGIPVSKSDLIEEKKTGNDADLSEAKRKLIHLAKGCSEEDAERFLQMFELVLGRK